jgi:hypothetical protein
VSHRSHLIDQLLEEARKKGIYNAELRGEGPLLFDDTTHVDPADRVAFQLLKSNGFAPAFLEERTQLLLERQRLSSVAFVLHQQLPHLDIQKRSDALREMRRVLTDLWRRTLDYNLTAPAVFQIEGIRVDFELQRIEMPPKAILPVPDERA